MRRALWALGVGAVAAAFACLPERHEVVGGACDRLHPCPDDLECVANVCTEAPDGGLPDVLENGGFELGLTGWQANTDATVLSLVQEPVRRGSSAGRVGAGPPDSSRIGVVWTAPIPVDAGQTWCVEAFVQRGTIRGEIGLVSRAYSEGGDWVDAPPQFGSSTLPPDDGWHPLRRELTVAAPHDHRINFRLSADFEADAGFHLDDARAWPAPCP